MTPEDITTLIRKKTRTTSTEFDNDEVKLYLNTFKDELASRIQQERPGVWQMPAYDDLVEDQREYAFPLDVLNNIVSVALKFSSSGNYVPAYYYNRRFFDDSLQESRIVAAFDNTNPRYFVRRKAIFILSGSISDMIDGLWLVYNCYPSDITDLSESTTDISEDPSTTEHGFPKEFHEVLARRVSIEYKDINEIRLTSREARYEDDLDDLLDNFSPAATDKPVIGGVPSLSQRGDYGFDY